jgi:hypothetical protein
MKTVAVIGSAKGFDESVPIARELGSALASNGFAVLTGAGEGLPLAAAAAAKAAGALVIGVSPEHSLDSHRREYAGQADVFDAIICTGFGRPGRNVVLVRSADAIIMVGGRTGTLNEFTIAFEEGKPIGVLEGSGGASDMVRSVAELGRGKGSARIVYSENPAELVAMIQKLLQ